MTSVAVTHPIPAPRTRAPSIPLLLAIAAAGAVTAVVIVALGLENDVAGIQIALMVWIVVPYIAAGLLAWRLRPASRLGPLMIVGGFATGVSALQFASNETLLTIGAVFDILVAAVFLHVFLAFPDGRLRSTYERVLVGGAYVVAVGLQLVKLLLGAFPNKLAIGSRPPITIHVERLQLLSISAM